MAFIDKFNQDNKYRALYGLGMPGDPGASLYILEFLIPQVKDEKILTTLMAESSRINKT